MSIISQALVEGRTLVPNDVIHVLGYGLGLLAAGLFVMHRGPLVR
jgi:hypothetical protein